MFSSAATDIVLPELATLGTSVSDASTVVPSTYSLSDVLSPFKGSSLMKGGATSDTKHGTCLIVYSDSDFFEEYPTLQTNDGITKQNNVLFDKLIEYINGMIDDTNVDIHENNLYKNRDVIKTQISKILDLYSFKNVNIRLPTNMKRSSHPVIQNRRRTQKRNSFMDKSQSSDYKFTRHQRKPIFGRNISQRSGFIPRVGMNPRKMTRSQQIAW